MKLLTVLLTILSISRCELLSLGLQLMFLKLKKINKIKSLKGESVVRIASPAWGMGVMGGRLSKSTVVFVLALVFKFVVQ